MTHTLHRKGTRESLNRDYIFLCMAAKGINEDGADDKMREFLRIVIKHNAVNIGDMRTGNIFCCNPEEIINKVTSTSIVHGVFTDPKTVVKVMNSLRVSKYPVHDAGTGNIAYYFLGYSKIYYHPHITNITALCLMTILRNSRILSSAPSSLIPFAAMHRKI